MEEQLITAYGKAMQRLGELEKEVAALRRFGVRDQSPVTEDFEKEKALNEGRARFAQLETQVASLDSQLKRAEERYRAAAEGNLSRHRRSHRAPWWRFWGISRARVSALCLSLCPLLMG